MSFRALRRHSERSEESPQFAQGKLREESRPGLLRKNQSEIPRYARNDTGAGRQKRAAQTSCISKSAAFPTVDLEKPQTYLGRRSALRPKLPAQPTLRSPQGSGGFPFYQLLRFYQLFPFFSVFCLRSDLSNSISVA